MVHSITKVGMVPLERTPSSIIPDSLRCPRFWGESMTTFEGPIEWPELERYSDRPMFNTKAVVQQTGILAPTLRAWERRYALFAPKRADNDYRLYTERDIVLLRWLRDRVEHGMSISQAIALYRHLDQNQAQHSKSDQELAHVVQAEKPTLEEYFDYTVSPQTHAREDSALPQVMTKSPPFSHTRQESGQPFANRDEIAPYQERQEHTLNSYPTLYNMQIARDNLLEIFRRFDEQAANVIIGSLLSLYPMERVCTELIIPTLWHIGTLWAEGKLTISTEHFASNFFRALLTNRFHITPSPLQGPLVLVCSSPNETHEIAALMLALFLRQRGLRVAYLGQSIETTGLLHTVRKLHPAALCISVTIPTHISALTNLARQVHNLPSPRPLFAFGGQAFSAHPDIVTQIPGQYYQGDLRNIADSLYRVVCEQCTEKKEL
jgi:DNA-binding transcriptional MerR regulator